MRDPSLATPGDSGWLRRHRSLPWLLAILVAGAAIRCQHWWRVFTAEGVRFAVDSDPLYHSLQAERILDRGLAGIWFDAALNWPVGAQVPWPPLFDLAIAGLARVAFGAAPTPDQVARAAAILPVLVGLATIPVVAGIGRSLLGPRRGMGAALVFSLLMAHVVMSTVGRADQHVAEVLFHAWIGLSFVWTWRAESPRARAAAAAATGLGVALAFWNWMGSALDLVLPVGFACLAYVLLQAGESRRVASGLAAAMGWATLLLCASVTLWVPPEAARSGSLMGIGYFHVALTAWAAMTGALLWAATRLRPLAARPLARLVAVVVAAAAPAALALAVFPEGRLGLASGLAALRSANPWYDSIFEFRPLLFSCHLPLVLDLYTTYMFFGLALPASLVGVASLVHRWRRHPSERPSALFLAGWLLLFLALALQRRRFAAYLTVPLAALSWEGAWVMARAAGRRLWAGREGFTRAAAAALGIATVLPCVIESPLIFSQVSPASISAMQWLSTQPMTPFREGVLTGWDLGHVALYHARRPVVATPFGTEGGAGAMEDTARFRFATDPGQAAELLARRRIGYVAMTDPRIGAFTDAALAAPGSDWVLRSCNYRQGLVLAFAPAYEDTMAARLFFRDGLPSPSSPATVDYLRLIHEAGGPGRELKIFGVVTGAVAVVSRAPPGAPVRSEVRLRTNAGRTIAWSTDALAGPDGVAVMRLPYSTGMNGSVAASDWTATSGARSARFRVSEAQVASGDRMSVVLDGAGPP